jgi:hypothetical protein
VTVRRDSQLIWERNEAAAGGGTGTWGYQRFFAVALPRKRFFTRTAVS